MPSDRPSVQRILRRLTMALLAVSVALPTASAQAATFVDGRTFGLHVPQIGNGVDPSVSYGSIRLWDAGISWGLVERRRGSYSWGLFDRVIANARAQNLEIVYVLGGTPRWAARDTRQGTYPNAGAASPPRSMSDWRRWVTKVATRYRASIDAYQIWNEANLATFWQGTPAQMAQMTLEAKRIIRTIDPTATVVAASSTVRLTTAFNRFYPTYLSELRKRRWPVDVFAIHTYGPSTATPALREAYIRKARAALRDARAPRRPLWDTEVNYGIAGPGSRYPDRDLDAWQSAIFTSQTYLDSVRLRIARTHWYAWTPAWDLLGVTLQEDTPAATAFETTVRWLVNATVACTNDPVRVCFVDRAGTPSQVAWTSSGPDRPFTVPAYATRMCTVLNECREVQPGGQVVIGRMPMAFTTS